MRGKNCRRGMSQLAGGRGRVRRLGPLTRLRRPCQWRQEQAGWPDGPPRAKLAQHPPRTRPLGRIGQRDRGEVGRQLSAALDRVGTGRLPSRRSRGTVGFQSEGHGMNGSNRISVRIERGATAGLADGPSLEAAGRALTEAQANLNHLRLQTEQRLTQKQVVALSNELASEAWEADELRGEAPSDPLHPESSGWRLQEQLLERSIPLLLFVGDVIDCVAMHMATSDTLVLEVQA